MTRVLIVDDGEVNLHYLRAVLEGNAYIVDAARNGAEALDLARRTRPDLVISDLLMPVMDGYTLLRQWKEDGDLREVPFLVYTATYTEPEDERLALELGADAFLVKPTEPEELLAKIREVRDRGAVAVPSMERNSGSPEEGVLEAYNQVLVRKLEQKMRQLEESNAALQKEIGERTRAKEELERSSALLRIAGQAARLGGWALRIEDGTLTWSEEACAIYDLGRGDAPTLEEAVHYCIPEYREKFQEEFEACVRAGEPFDYEFEIVTAMGRRRWVRAIGEAARDSAGSVVRIQGALQDVSDRRNLEETLLRATRMESIGLLAGGMAHDLSNVLTPILLSIHPLKEQVEDEMLQESLATIESCALRGAEMVKHVMSFARGIDETQARVDLIEILGDLGRVVYDTFPDSVRFRTRISGDLWDLMGDSTQLHQVLMNLFVNARDAMPDGGLLTVIAENIEVDDHYAATSGDAVPGPYVRVSVVDTGVGMSPEVLSRIFDPLFTTKPPGRGTGLGLSTVAVIVHNHLGFINVYSEEGEGTTFRLHFPASGEVERANPLESPPEEWKGNDELLLVVDDEAAVRSLTQQTLEAFGYRVVIARDGVDALRAFESRADDIDLVFTDTTMPNMDGPAMIKELLRLDPEVRIIVASGLGADGGEGRAAEAGAKYFVPKPYTADVLLAAIRRALSEEGGSSKDE